MNKKCITGIILLLLMCISISGCSLTEVNITEITNSRLLPIETETDLYYDKDTKIVYIIFDEKIGYAGFGYMSPYYSAGIVSSSLFTVLYLYTCPLSE